MQQRQHTPHKKKQKKQKKNKKKQWSSALCTEGRRKNPAKGEDRMNDTLTWTRNAMLKAAVEGNGTMQGRDR